MAAGSKRKPGWQDYAAAIKTLSGWNTLDKAPFLTFVYGPSEYGLNQVSSLLKQLASKSEAHVSCVEGAQFAAEHVTTFCDQGSLFEPTTLYLIRRFEQSRQAANLLAQIASPAARSASDNKLCLVSRSEGPLAGVKKELDRLKAFVVPCFDPWPSELPGIVHNMAADIGLKLDKNAAFLLIEANGSDLVKLDNELKKLAYVFYDIKQVQTLSSTMIAPHIGMLREDDAFQLDQLLLKKEWAKAHILVTHLIERGEKPTALVGILARHCRNAIKALEILKKGATIPEVASHLRLPQFVAKNYAQYLSKANPCKFATALEECRRADFLLKSSSIDDEILLSGIVECLTRP